MDFSKLQYDCDAPFVKSQLSLIGQYLSSVSMSPGIVSCVGVVVDVIKTLDRSPSNKLACIIHLTSKN